MQTLESLAPGTFPQWGTFATAVITLVGLVTVWVKMAPERARVRNEAKALEVADAETLRAEMVELNKLARTDIHDLRNELAKVDATQKKCTKALAEAHAENRMYRDDMNTLLFLIRLLIKEVKRLDTDPGNIIIEQAEMTLTELQRKHEAPVGNDLAETADRAVEAAVHSVEAAVATAEEVKGAGK